MANLIAPHASGLRTRNRRERIRSRKYVLESGWGDEQPDTQAQKARNAFVYGDLRRLHRAVPLCCVYRATQWRHEVD